MVLMLFNSYVFFMISDTGNVERSQCKSQVQNSLSPVGGKF